MIKVRIKVQKWKSNRTKIVRCLILKRSKARYRA
jgi:hypothetical protein